MAAKLDETDIYIIKALLEDGRATYSKIAKSLALSTPTVEARIRKMRDLGLVKRFSAVLDADKLGDNITAVLTASADFNEIDRILESLSGYDEVREAYLATGEHNLIMKVVVRDVKELYDFQQQKLSKVNGIRLASNYIITRTVKEEPRARLEPGMGVRLRCDECKGEVHGKPVVVTYEGRPRFLCCKGCAETFSKKFKN